MRIRTSLKRLSVPAHTHMGTHHLRTFLVLGGASWGWGVTYLSMYPRLCVAVPLTKLYFPSEIDAGWGATSARPGQTRRPSGRRRRRPGRGIGYAKRRRWPGLGPGGPWPAACHRQRADVEPTGSAIWVSRFHHKYAKGERVITIKTSDPAFTNAAIKF